MRIPHHLIRSTTGLWSFRQRVPRDLQACVGLRVVKHALRTRDMPAARLRALALAAGYAQAFARLRVSAMTKKDIDALLASLRGKTLHDFTIERDATGKVTIRADPGEDARAAVDTLESIGRFAPHFFAPAPASVAAPEAAQPAMPSITPLALDKAQDLWLAAIKPSTSHKTFVIKTTAIEGLVRFLGTKREVHTVLRPDLAGWYQSLRDAGLSTPTLVNKQSYIGGKQGFFAWAMASGYYPVGDNPAAGHVSYSVREKRRRRKLGFVAFDRDQVLSLFAPEAFVHLSAGARWAALLGLYSGARASEVGQLHTRDVIVGGGVPALRITDEGEHQRVKTDASLREVPLHPDLIALGFLEFVAQLGANRPSRLFPQAKADAINGAGNWISKAFSRHLSEVGKTWPKAKRGFHNLRKTAIQTLQGLGVASELRAQLVGHELDDEHHPTYSREFTLEEKLRGVGRDRFHSPGLACLDYGL